MKTNEAHMSSSRGKGKRPTTSDQNLVVPDGRDVHIQCFWKERQNVSIALTRGWPQFYRRYQINLDSMLYFQHIGNSNFQVRIFDFCGRENTYYPRHTNNHGIKSKALTSMSDVSIILLSTKLKP
ncbi:hypothetical protein S83_035540 [Arachis hypogaea]|nr:uncharacterized protein DS421_11g334140 [Arachis hypogaea]